MTIVDQDGRARRAPGAPASSGGQFASQASPAAAAALPEPARDPLAIRLSLATERAAAAKANLQRATAASLADMMQRNDIELIEVDLVQERVGDFVVRPYRGSSDLIQHLAAYDQDALRDLAKRRRVPGLWLHRSELAARAAEQPEVGPRDHSIEYNIERANQLRDAADLRNHVLEQWPSTWLVGYETEYAGEEDTTFVRTVWLTGHDGNEIELSQEDAEDLRDRVGGMAVDIHGHAAVDERSIDMTHDWDAAANKAFAALDLSGLQQEIDEAKERLA